MLSDRKLAVEAAAATAEGVGHGQGGDVPAYVAMQDQLRLSAWMLDILMRGVSTRQYRGVIPEMAERWGFPSPA